MVSQSAGIRRPERHLRTVPHLRNLQRDTRFIQVYIRMSENLYYELKKKTLQFFGAGGISAETGIWKGRQISSQEADSDCKGTVPKCEIDGTVFNFSPVWLSLHFMRCGVSSVVSCQQNWWGAVTPNLVSIFLFTPNFPMTSIAFFILKYLTFLLTNVVVIKS